MAGSIAGGRAARQQARGQAQYNAAIEANRRENYYRQIDYQQRLAEFQESNFIEFAASAEKSMQGQFGAVIENLDQRRNMTMQSINKSAQKAATGMAFTASAAAESGVTGSSITQAMNAYQQAEARATTVEFENYKNTVRQGQRNIAAYRASAQSAVNRALPAPLPPVQVPPPVGGVSQPSMTPYVLNGISSGISTGFSTLGAMTEAGFYKPST